MSHSRRYQFTVRRLLLLTTATALAFALAGGLRGPLLFRVFIGVYLATELAWIVMRWPHIWRVSQRRRLAVIQKQRELAIEVAKQKPRVARPQPHATEAGPNADSQ